MLSAAAAQASRLTMEGFVTQANSPVNFSMGSQRVTISEDTVCDKFNTTSAIKIREITRYLIVMRRDFTLQIKTRGSVMQGVPCNQLHLTIGSMVRVSGDNGINTRSLHAKHVTLYQIQFQQKFSDIRAPNVWKSAALLEEAPHLVSAKGSWSGTLWLDGFPMVISPGVYIFRAPEGTHTVYRPSGLFSSPRLRASSKKSVAMLLTENTFKPNIWASYHRMSIEEGPLRISQLKLWPNFTSPEEERFQESHSPALENLISGALSDKASQSYVSAIGESLVPSYQEELQTRDTTKIRFQFIIVKATQRSSLREPAGRGKLSLPMDTIADSVAIAYPNGTILVADTAISRLTSEAQLAALLSDCITSVIQKHEYIANTSRTDSGFAGGSDIPDFSRYVMALGFHEQTLRIGIRQMYLDGYDIREAPYAWAVAQGKRANNPIIDSKNPDKEIPWYTAYAFNYISQYYGDIDYSKLKIGRKDYQRFLRNLKKSDPQAFVSKNN